MRGFPSLFLTPNPQREILIPLSFPPCSVRVPIFRQGSLSRSLHTTVGGLQVFGQNPDDVPGARLVLWVSAPPGLSITGSASVLMLSGSMGSPSDAPSPPLQPPPWYHAFRLRRVCPSMWEVIAIASTRPGPISMPRIFDDIYHMHITTGSDERGLRTGRELRVRWLMIWSSPIIFPPSPGVLLLCGSSCCGRLLSFLACGPVGEGAPLGSFVSSGRLASLSSFALGVTVRVLEDLYAKPLLRVPPRGGPSPGPEAVLGLALERSLAGGVILLRGARVCSSRPSSPSLTSPP